MQMLNSLAQPHIILKECFFHCFGKKSCGRVSIHFFPHLLPLSFHYEKWKQITFLWLAKYVLITALLHLSKGSECPHADKIKNLLWGCKKTFRESPVFENIFRVLITRSDVSFLSSSQLETETLVAEIHLDPCPKTEYLGHMHFLLWEATTQTSGLQ